ncbi:MAG TPA: efflux RND transporter permease subunit [Candidatus Limnocylindrales bacterium]|nr:efflux RND transporter permease subunit [Candidatus Limnocylindrales bacterium]
MPRFSIRNPYFIIVACLVIISIGTVSYIRMPVDLFPNINIPVVEVATFYNGMPPEEIENEITSVFERFFTLGSGIDHMESRSLPGVSIIKIFFQPGTDPDADVSEISNLAMADLRRLPPGTFPPIVLKFDASSLPVCLVTLKGTGLTETQLRDIGQFTVRTQLAVAQGASVPQPFGGRYRQIMVYVDPSKLQSHDLSLMDVVRAVNDANIILPAGDAKIGPYDYNIYTNSQIGSMSDINRLPIKTVGTAPVTVGDVGVTKDASTIQTNIVRVDGQQSVYLPIMKQGGDTNTIAVVNEVRDVLNNLVDIPKQLETHVVFDQSEFVKDAINTIFREGSIGLLLTALMVLIFLSSLRATLAVFLSIPLSALAAVICLYFGGGSINSMVLAGLAIVFSRLIDNSVIVLENIFRHLEMGEPPEVAAEKGGQEVALAVLAATITSAVVFFPVTFLYGVSRFLFSALALAVVLALFASYFVALTVVPLFCAKLIKSHSHAAAEVNEYEELSGRARAKSRKTIGQRFNERFYRVFEAMLKRYDNEVKKRIEHPWRVVGAVAAVFLISLLVFPLLGEAFFPRSDAGEFVITLKAPSGTRIEMTNDIVAQAENIVRKVIPPNELRLIVSNIGITSDFSAMYTTNSGPHTATIQVELNGDHKVSSFDYMDRVRTQINSELPSVSIFLTSGGVQEAVLNQGLPAPIDIQVVGSRLESTYAVAQDLAHQIRGLASVSGVFIPQDLDYPSLRVNVDRLRAGELGLNQKEVVDNVVTALTSNGMIAPSYWVDPKSGIEYLLTVQYNEKQINSLGDVRNIPIRSQNEPHTSLLDAVSKIAPFQAPTEVDHYQVQRIIDIYVTPRGEDLRRVANSIQEILAHTPVEEGIRVELHGMVLGMRASFVSFGLGLLFSLLLLYLVLVAQFRSFVDPFLILLAVPPGLTGVLILLYSTGTTLNVLSLMGIIMMVGMVVSNSILIVEFAHRLQEEGRSARDAVVDSCRIRLRPILMTSLATVFGLIPMALKFGTGSEAYAPLARAIIGGLVVSVIVTIFIVPAAYILVFGRRSGAPEVSRTQEA